jgi:hypothetical protein
MSIRLQAHRDNGHLTPRGFARCFSRPAANSTDAPVNITRCFGGPSTAGRRARRNDWPAGWQVARWWTEDSTNRPCSAIFGRMPEAGRTPRKQRQTLPGMQRCSASAWRESLSLTRAATLAGCAEASRRTLTSPEPSDDGLLDGNDTGRAGLTVTAPDGFTQGWSFTAKLGRDPLDKFHWSGRLFGQHVEAYGDTTCFAMSRDDARFAGVVTRSNISRLVGTTVGWRVEDNGGRSSAPTHDRPGRRRGTSRSDKGSLSAARAASSGCAGRKPNANCFLCVALEPGLLAWKRFHARQRQPPGSDPVPLGRESAPIVEREVHRVDVHPRPREVGRGSGRVSAGRRTREADDRPADKTVEHRFDLCWALAACCLPETLVSADGRD